MSLDAAHDPADAPTSDDGIAERDAAWETERAAIRAQIEAAVDAADPHPVARRTLALLVEAEVAVAAEAPGYRVVGRPGVPQPPTESGERPTLDDLVGALRDRHPALFKPPEPDPVVPEEPPPALAKQEGAASHAWAKRSARARTLVAASGARARVLATTARTRLRGVRTRVEDHFARIPPDAGREVAGEATMPSPPTKSPAARADRLGGQAMETGLRLRHRAGALSAAALERGRLGWDDTRDALAAGGILRRPSTIAALAGIGLLGLVVLVATRDDGPRRTEAPAPTQAVPEPPPAAQPQAQVSPAPSPAPVAKPVQPTPVPDDEPAPDDAPMQAETAPQAGEISGPAEVIDTATLKVGGRVVRLFGVVWVRGGQTDELARYLGKRAVSCRPVAGSDAHLCSVDGRDLSEVVLFNGGGRASPEATPDLVAAEDRARSERLGVWAR